MINIEAPREVMASIKPRWFRLVELWELVKPPRNQHMISLLKGETPFKWILKGLSGSPRNYICPTPGWLAKTYYNKRNPCSKAIFERWGGLLIPNLNLKDIMKNTKEGLFIWSLWHKAVAINSWHARYVTNEDDKRHMCPWNHRNHCT